LESKNLKGIMNAYERLEIFKGTVKVENIEEFLEKLKINDCIAIFVDSNYVFFISNADNNTKIITFSKDLIKKYDFEIPEFDNIFRLKNNNFLLTKASNKLHLYIVSPYSGITEEHTLPKIQITDYKSMSYDNCAGLIFTQNDTLLLFNDVSSFALINIHGKIIWTENNVFLPFYESKKYFVLHDSLILYNTNADSVMLLLPDKKFFAKYEKLSDITGFPCFDYIDYNKLLAKQNADSIVYIENFAKEYKILSDIIYIYDDFNFYYFTLDPPLLDSIMYWNPDDNYAFTFYKNKFWTVKNTSYDFLDFTVYNIHDTTYSYIYEQTRLPDVSQISICNDTIFVLSKNGIASFKISNKTLNENIM